MKVRDAINQLLTLPMSADVEHYNLGAAPQPASNNFDGSLEPMRALRDLINECEAITPFVCDQHILRRAKDGLTALRAFHGDLRPAEDVGDGPMVEPRMLRLLTPDEVHAGCGYHPAFAALSGIEAPLQRADPGAPYPSHDVLEGETDLPGSSA